MSQASNYRESSQGTYPNKLQKWNNMRQRPETREAVRGRGESLVPTIPLPQSMKDNRIQADDDGINSKVPFNEQIGSGHNLQRPLT